MATIGELSILLSVKGVSQTRSALKEVSEETGRVKQSTDELTKSAKESAEVFENQFRKEFRASQTALRSFGRDLTQIATLTRNVGLAITGPFIASFAIARKEIPAVDAELKRVTDSFKAMAMNVSVASLPALKQFSSFMSSTAKVVSAFVTEHQKMTNALLILGSILTVNNVVLGGLAQLIKALTAIRALLVSIGILTKTGAFTVMGAALLTASVNAAALYDWLNKIKDLPVSLKVQEIAKFVTNPVGTLAGSAMQTGSNVLSGKKSSPLNTPTQGPAGMGDRPGGMQGTAQLPSEALKNDLPTLAQELGNVRMEVEKVTNEVKENVITMTQGVTSNFLGMFSSFADGVGDSFAQAIVFGEDFGQAMTSVLKNLAAEIISMLVSVIAKIVVLRSLGVVGPIPAAALFGGAGGFAEAAGESGGGRGIGGFFKNIFGFAEGGVVTKPTLGIFGEAGPEAVVPLDKMGQMGGEVHIHLNGHTFLNDESAIDILARRVSDGFKRATQRRTGGTTIAL